ncbi:hypothetical protein LMG31506_06155 [Cupriavidus yeoncheonensis]|uniref:Uncharacterized protein n=1 Tax=Cupriavidus yeoncheonensis TaxID=1462994 RepID=A0A916J1U0_9BURK|nr:hypothetical protein LMG31506_06155 [Cupriavidus yeoncheonensis]
MHSTKRRTCAAISSPNTVEGFENSVALDCDLRSGSVWSEPLQRNQLARTQLRHIRTVQFCRVGAVFYQYQGGELMMTQHSRLLRYWSNSATGLHCRPSWRAWRKTLPLLSDAGSGWWGACLIAPGRSILVARTLLSIRREGMVNPRDSSRLQPQHGITSHRSQRDASPMSCGSNVDRPAGDFLASHLEAAQSPKRDCIARAVERMPAGLQGLHPIDLDFSYVRIKENFGRGKGAESLPVVSSEAARGRKGKTPWPLGK